MSDVLCEVEFEQMYYDQGSHAYSQNKRRSLSYPLLTAIAPFPIRENKLP
ncbi:MAG: hypothetical protein VKL42_17025 [Snowella sp.]|nr:hypothetical protein [Snowella sp.]